MSNSLRKWQECCQRTEPDLGTGHDCDGKALVRETIELAFRFLSGRFKAGSSLARANEVQSVVGQHSQVCLRCICKLARNDVTEDPLSQSVTNLSRHDLSSVLKIGRFGQGGAWCEGWPNSGKSQPIVRTEPDRLGGLLERDWEGRRPEWSERLVTVT